MRISVSRSDCSRSPPRPGLVTGDNYRALVYALGDEEGLFHGLEPVRIPFPPSPRCCGSERMTGLHPPGPLAHRLALALAECALGLL